MPSASISPKGPSQATDWDRYYRAPAPTARLTRRYTTRTLLVLMRRLGAGPSSRIAELGGANSCFLDRLLAGLRPARYHIVDNNQLGLSLLSRHGHPADQVTWQCADVLAWLPILFSILSLAWAWWSTSTGREPPAPWPRTLSWPAPEAS